MKKYHIIKMQMCRYFLCLFLVGITHVAKGQPSAAKIDSLKHLLSIAPDTAGLRIHFFIAQLYLKNGVYDSQLVHANAAIGIAEKIPSLSFPQKKFNAGALRLKGIYYRSNGELETAISIYISALSEFESLKDTGGMASTTNSIGIAYLSLKRYGEARDYFLKAYELDHALGKPEKESADLMNVCNALLGNGNMPDSVNIEALMYARRANDLALQSKDDRMIIRSTEAVATCLRNANRLDEAMVYQLRALHLADSLKMPEQLAEQQYQMAQLYHEMREYDKAIYYDLQAEQLANKYGYDEYYFDIYLGLAEAYEKTGSYDKAYAYMKKLKEVTDKTYQTQITDQLKRFESNKKDNEIKLLNVSNQLKEEEAHRQKQLKNFFIAGAVLLLLIAAGLVNRYQIKQRSEKKLAEKNKIIEKEKQRAEQSEQFKSQFLANMSHEIRTPMNAVIGITNLLLDEPQTEKNLRYLNIIRHSSENLLVIINDILDLSKLDAGKMLLENIPFRVTDVLNSVQETLEWKAREKGLKFIVDADKNIPAVLSGDPSRLIQLLLNLAGNAIKFTEQGSVIINCRLQIGDYRLGTESAISNPRSEVARVTFAVSDTGIGIEKEKVESIFESFRQANTGDARKYGGTGLGLTISKELVELFGSKLEVESQPGAGSVFSFTASFGISSEELFSQYHEEKDGFLPDDLFGLKILLAEDNEHNQLVTVDTLKKIIDDADVDVVTNGKEVLEKMKNRLHGKRYDLILMDVQMPEMDGYEATRQIRNPQSAIQDHTIPIIALTASVIRSDLKKCIEAGMNSYVAKPFTKQTLANEIGKVLQRNQNPDRSKTFSHTVSRNSVINTGYDKNNGSDAWPAIKKVNFAHLHEVGGDNAEKTKQYLEQFLELVPRRLEHLQIALKNNSLSEIYQAAHILKPQLGFFGMTREELIANTIEMKVFEISQPELLELVSQLESGCKAALIEIENELK